MEITKQAALDALTAEVEAAGPDYTYDVPHDDKGWEVCVYVRGGCPSCLIGRVLYRLGVPVEVLADLDRRSVSEITHSAVRTRLTDAGFTLTRRAAEMLGAAQKTQDSGLPWGKALASAQHYLSTNRE